MIVYQNETPRKKVFFHNFLRVNFALRMGWDGFWKCTMYLSLYFLCHNTNCGIWECSGKIELIRSVPFCSSVEDRQSHVLHKCKVLGDMTEHCWFYLRFRAGYVSRYAMTMSEGKYTRHSRLSRTGWSMRIKEYNDVCIICIINMFESAHIFVWYKKWTNLGPWTVIYTLGMLSVCVSHTRSVKISISVVRGNLWHSKS